MERTKGILKLEHKEANYVNLMIGDYCVASICTSESNGEFDAEHIKKCWNAHEPGGKVEKLVEACRRSRQRFIEIGREQYPTIIEMINEAIEGS